MADSENIQKYVLDQRVLYISTKNRDYLRIEQEIMLLEEYAKSLDIIVSRNKSYFMRLLYVYFELLFNYKKYDIVFIGFAPQLILPFFKWKFRKSRIMIDFFISLYDTFVFDRKKFKKTSLWAQVLKKLDIITLKYTDIIICDTKVHAKFFVDVLYADRKKIKILYLNADSKYYFHKAIKKPIQFEEQFIVLYFGSILPLQGIDVILEAIEKITEKKIHFIIIGPLNKQIKHLKNITNINWINQEKLADYIAFADLCLAGHFNGSIEKAKRTIPGKAYIYEAMRKRFILGENKANHERYPSCYDNIRFVEMGNSEALASVILQEYEKFQKQNKI